MSKKKKDLYVLIFKVCLIFIFHLCFLYLNGGVPFWGKKNLSVCTHISIIFVTLWTVTCQDLLPMEFSKQEYWRGLPFPSPGDLPDPEIMSLLHWQANSLPSEPPGKPIYTIHLSVNTHILCVYIYIHAYTYTYCISVYIFSIHIHIPIHMHLYTNTHVYTQTHVHTHRKIIPTWK